jgi:homocysteine S-methyltransferase
MRATDGRPPRTPAADRPAGDRSAADRFAGAASAADRIADDPFAPILALRGVVVLDGGLATQLEAQGNSLADPLWSARLLLENPAEIVRAHLAFYRAGAAVATTASYQATFEGFAARGIDRAGAVDLLRRSVALASEARAAWRAERPPDDHGALLVAASIGPYGAFLANGGEYTGRYGRSVAQLRDFHRERLEVLVATDADLLACETIPELEEGIALVELLEATPGARGWLSFSCADGAHLRSGAAVDEAFALAEQSSRVLAVGVNCTAPEHVDELLARARSATSKPLIVYPNNGEGWDPVARRWIRRPGPTVDGTAARRWIQEGATIVGGCCRVSPDQIEEVSAMVTELARKRTDA